MQTKLKLLTAAAVIVFSSSTFAQSPQEHEQHHPSGAPTQAQPAQPSQPAPSGQPAQSTPPTPDQPTQQSSPPTAGQPPGRMPTGQMMQGMPEQCRTMMQSMPQNCMSMMQEMMRGEMRQGGTMGGMMGGGMHGGMMGRGMQAPASASAATKGYMEAANKMYGPMVDGLQADDPDVAFVRAIIAQRQGAIELAKVRVQFGKDEQTRKWADDIIRTEQAAINDMEAWLKQRSK